MQSNTKQNNKNGDEEEGRSKNRIEMKWENIWLLRHHDLCQRRIELCSTNTNKNK